MPVQAEQLLRAQELDLRIGALARERAGLDDGTSLKQELDALVAALEAARKKFHGLEADQANAELEQKTIEEKKALFQRRLYEGKVTNPKELQAMEQEIEMLGRQRGRLDERILTLMDEIETTGAEVERLTTEEASTRERYDAHCAAYKKRLAAINGELKELLPQRNTVAGQVDASTLSRYEDIRKKAGGLAAARLQDGRCGGCKVNVSTVMQRQAEEGERYTYCENCGRFMFGPAG